MYNKEKVNWLVAKFNKLADNGVFTTVYQEVPGIIGDKDVMEVTASLYFINKNNIQGAAAHNVLTVKSICKDMNEIDSVYESLLDGIIRWSILGKTVVSEYVNCLCFKDLIKDEPITEDKGN